MENSEIEKKFSEESLTVNINEKSGLSKSKDKNRLGLLLIILALVVIFPTGVFGYLLVTDQLDFNNNDVEEEEVEDEELNWTDWNGDYLKAGLPEGWSVEEVVDSEYWEGLVGFYIKDETDSIIFQLQYNSGLGGYYTCESTFIKFSDYNPEELQNFLEVYEENVAEGKYDCPEEPLISDFGDDYVSVTFLNKELRRTNDWYYIDSREDTSYFEYNLVAGNIIGTDMGEYLYSSQICGWEESKQLILDSVLESVEIINSTPVTYIDVTDSTVEGIYQGINSQVIDGNVDYFSFQNCDWEKSTCTYYLVDSESVSYKESDFTVGNTYSIIGVETENEGGVATGSSYIVMKDVRFIISKKESTEIITVDGTYQGVNTEALISEKSYFSFQNCDWNNSTCTYYLVDVDGVSYRESDFTVGNKYSITGVKTENGGAAAGSSYVEIADVSLISSVINSSSTNDWKTYSSTEYGFSFKYEDELSENHYGGDLLTLGTKYFGKYDFSWFVMDGSEISFEDLLDSYVNDSLVSKEVVVKGGIGGTLLEFKGYTSSLDADPAHLEFFINSGNDVYHRIRIYSDEIEMTEDCKETFNLILENVIFK